MVGRARQRTRTATVATLNRLACVLRREIGQRRVRLPRITHALVFVVLHRAGRQPKTVL